MPCFSAEATIAGTPDEVFETLADATTFPSWGTAPASRRTSVDHLGGPPTGEGAAFRVLERLGNGALANYELTVAGCERPGSLTLRAPRAFDRTFTCEATGEGTTRLLEVRTYPDRPQHLVARLFAADLRRRPGEEAIREELERLGALFARPPRERGPAAGVSG